MNKEILLKLGLTESEINVYLTLNSLGDSLASKIAKRCNLHRTSVYDALDKLIKKGLVSFVIKENRKYFQATDAEKILNLLNEKEEEIGRERNEVKTLIDELKRKEKLSETSVQAQIYQGSEGFKTVMEDILKSGAKEWLILGASGKSVKITPYFMPSFLRRISKEKVKLRVIYGYRKESDESRKEIAKYTEVNLRFMPPEIKNITTIHIYADKVAMIPDPSTLEEELVIFLIKNEKMAKSFKDYFEWMWKQAKP